ncbi:MAG: hypothetical protein ABIQ98_03715 [Sphingomicrobium sp.]
MEAGKTHLEAQLIAEVARSYEADDLPLDADVTLPAISYGERLALLKLLEGRQAAAGRGFATGGFVQESEEQIAAQDREVSDRLIAKLKRVRQQMMDKRRREGGIEVGKLVLEPGWTWQGEGPMPTLPGQDDDQGWDAIGREED